MRSKRLYTQAWLQRPKTSGHSRVVVLTCKCRANFVRKDRKELKSTRDLPENIDVDMGSSKSKDQQVRKETKEKWKMENHRDGLLNFGGSDRGGGGISTRKTTSLLVLPHFPPLSGYDGSWAYWKPEGVFDLRAGIYNRRCWPFLSCSPPHSWVYILSNNARRIRLDERCSPSLARNRRFTSKPFHCHIILKYAIVILPANA